ncbi:MAG: PAS domain-containing protein [Elusimicrobia bacterium]|nr:PAS domain-containing protein [Elusimicrobiota bacterium]MBD3412781.1 PAS domain-containing protein [Elusimicrobiota bacterium]
MKPYRQLDQLNLLFFFSFLITCIHIIILFTLLIISHNKFSNLYILIGLMFFSALMIFYTKTFLSVTRTMKEISYAIQRVSNGNWTRKITNIPSGYLGYLIHSINSLIDQTRYQIKEHADRKAQLEAILHHMLNGVMVVDKKGIIVLANQAFMKLFNIKTIPLGKWPLEIIRNITLHEIINEVLQHNTQGISKEISLLVSEEKKIIVFAAPIISNEHKEGVVCIFHDTTQLRKLENIRQDFVANVSHELRTPVASIKGYAETLLEGAYKDKKNVKEFLSIITSNADNLARLIEDLLYLSKIESGKLLLATKPCPIQPLIERALQVLHHDIKKKSIIINNEIPENLPPVNADDDRLGQVLMNLLDNAVKYNNQNGTITISVDELSDYFRFTITDTGIGIPSQNLPRLFERFYRVDKARSRELGGTGLGLSIVKHIIQAHNGQIFVQSELNKGSSFSFTIPKST